MGKKRDQELKKNASKLLGADVVLEMCGSATFRKDSHLNMKKIAEIL